MSVSGRLDAHLDELSLRQSESYDYLPDTFYESLEAQYDEFSLPSDPIAPDPIAPGPIARFWPPSSGDDRNDPFFPNGYGNSEGITSDEDRFGYSTASRQPFSDATDDSFGYASLSHHAPSLSIQDPLQEYRFSSPEVRFEDYLTPVGVGIPGDEAHEPDDEEFGVSSKYPGAGSQSAPSGHRGETFPVHLPPLDSASPRLSPLPCPILPSTDTTHVQHTRVQPPTAVQARPSSISAAISAAITAANNAPAATVRSGVVDDYDDGDEWLLNAANEARRVEETIPPPGPSRSRFFGKSAGPAPVATASTPTPVQVAPARVRQASTASVAFPKVPTPQPTSNRPPAHPAHATGTGNTHSDDDLVSVMALDTAAERQVFRFSHFNRMQSAIFQATYNGEENLVVTAPTGSGKTTVFDLALLHMLNTEVFGDEPLAVYMAPTKALVSERFRDWKARLGGLSDFTCCEVTGDTDFRLFGQALSKASLIVTTPEKWDSVTRRSSVIGLGRLKLLMVDEVHILGEERGPTLEVVISRMKRKQPSARIVAVSASVPNVDDVAHWIGKRSTLSDPQVLFQSSDGTMKEPDLEHMPKATVFRFGEDFRPVPLAKHTYSYDAFNEFVLGAKLDKELFAILNRHSAGKPVLIFCPTRKSCSQAAEHVYKDYEAAVKSRSTLPWDPRNNKGLVLKDAKTQEFTKYGIAIHHAGMDLSDRRIVEDAFRNGSIHCLISTSTLAVGVNLPAHLVVIKGTCMWQGQGFRDYSDIDIQQMMGRAGRPQFDTSGTVVLMCQSTKKTQYENILSARMPLESCLHQHLTEHINSEIGLENITDLQTGKAWIKSTFFAIRLRQNPRHYRSALVKDTTKTWDETLEIYMEHAIANLETHGLVECEDEENEAFRSRDGLHPTEMGRIMSKNMISYKTMRNILTMEESASVSSLLAILCSATEFSTLRVRQGEGGILNKVRTDSEIRYGLDEPVKTWSDKVFLHMQLDFGNVSLDKFAAKSENASPHQVITTIYNAAPRIAKAILLVAIEKQFGGAVVSALELLHTVNGRAWEDSATVFRQIPRIGPKSMAVLNNNGVTSFDDLAALHTGRVELWLKRSHPFGQEVINHVKTLPQFSVTFKEKALATGKEGYPSLVLDVSLSWTGILKRLEVRNQHDKLHNTSDEKLYALSGKFYTVTAILVTSTNRFVGCASVPAHKLVKIKRSGDKIVSVTPNPRNCHFEQTVTLHHPEERVVVIIGVDELSGVSNKFEYKPSVDRSLFPGASVATITAIPTPRSQTTKRASRTRDKSPPPRAAIIRQRGTNAQTPIILDDDVDVHSVHDDDDSEEVFDLTIHTPSAAAALSEKKRPQSYQLDSPPVTPMSAKKRRIQDPLFLDDEDNETPAVDSPDNDGDEKSVDSFTEFERVYESSRSLKNLPQHMAVSNQHQGRGSTSKHSAARLPSTDVPDYGLSNASSGFRVAPSLRAPFKPHVSLTVRDTSIAPESTPRTLAWHNISRSASPVLPPVNNEASMFHVPSCTPPLQPTEDFDEWLQELLGQRVG